MSPALTLDQVFPWGRNFDEYRAMFDLSEIDLTRRILGCGDGPASFNAALTARGGCMISADPLYQFSADEIRTRVDAARERIVANTRRNVAAYRWDRIPSIDAMVGLRIQAMEDFLADYETGKRELRYVAQSLPTLSFADRSFDLVLCSHFLYLYSPTLTTEFHIAAMEEMLRVGKEVRVFPLRDFDGGPSPHVAPVIEALRTQGCRAEIRRVTYEFLRGADQMLVATRYIAS